MPNINLRHAVLATCLLTAPMAASAEPVNGFYVSLGGGGTWVSSPLEQKSIAQNFTGAPGFALNLSNAGNTVYKPGMALVGAVGYGFSNGMRVELEGGYRQNGVSRFAPGPFTPIGLTFAGEERKTSLMANFIYDFNGLKADLGLPITPYIGVGLGISTVDWSNVSRFGGPLAFGPPIGTANTIFSTFSSTDVVLAAQGMVGFSYDIPGVPGLALTTDFRLTGLPQGFKQHGQLTLGFAPGSAFGTIKSPSFHDYGNEWNYGAMIGLRYAFGAPAPAAAPAAPVAAAVAPSPVSRSYIVFFDWDKADLTGRARQIVSEAAANSTKVQYTRLEVNGYTDASGTAQYNQSLSIRRAQLVASELVKDGVPKSAITIQGFGETHPLVPTAVGVREPQNRRVEIIIK